MVRLADVLLGVERGEVAYVFDSYVFPYGPFWETWSAVPSSTAHSDSEITRAIHDEFEWNPMLDPKDVNVQVRNGHATLTGRVNSQGQRIQATEEAYEGGAVAVDNRLTLSSGG